LNSRRAGHSLAVAEAEPSAAEGLVELNQVERDVAPRCRQLVLEIDERRLRLEDAVEVGDARLELQRDQLDRALCVADGVLELGGLLLGLQEADECILDLAARREHALLVLIHGLVELGVLLLDVVRDPPVVEDLPGERWKEKSCVAL